MITVEQALEILNQNVVVGAVEEMELTKALNRYLVEDIIAPMNVPSFNQSAMDGYAFKFDDVKDELEIVDEIPAGDIREIKIERGQAVRIFTGSMVPDSCDTVVMQELTEVENGKLLVKDVGLKKGGNIRLEGHQINQGDLALEKGMRINPAMVGFLTSLGITKVKVNHLPKVTVLATGDELVKSGDELKKGQVYESNTLMLSAVLSQFGIEADVIHLKDDFEATKNAISDVLSNSDILLISGGISVGDYDYVKPALEANDVEQLFYKVLQKPGKPLFFGKKEEKLIFALPGNPAAALNCFYIYVLPAINTFVGNPYSHLKLAKATLVHDYKKKSGRADFLKAQVCEGEVKLLEGQGSDVLKSFAEANAIVYIDGNSDFVKEGQEVTYYQLP